MRFSGGCVLALCADAGLAGVEVLAVDSTKVHANASGQVNRGYEQIAREILEQAGAIDAAEEEQFGERRGDELPAEFSTRAGRQGWLRDARRRLDAKRAAEARPIAQSLQARLREAQRRVEEDLRAECAANAAYEAYRAGGVMRDGRRFGRPPNPYQPPPVPVGKINVTDLDCSSMKTRRGFIQGYNAQAVVNEDRIILAAELGTRSPDFGLLAPTVTAALTELRAVGVADVPGIVLADAGPPHAYRGAF